MIDGSHEAAVATATGYRQGFSSLTSEVAVDRLPVEGRLPEWLEGTLLRTGPARFEVGAQPLRHWFDGLAMLHRFSFGSQEVSYSNRFLHSRAHDASVRTGRIGYREFATDPCSSLFRRVASFFSSKRQLTDNGNVNVTRVDEQFVAMTETCLPVRFDPETLETLGVAYEAPGQSATAHPHHDAARRELVNHAIHYGPRSSYRFHAVGSGMRQRRLATLSVSRPGYVHSFAMTERHLVLAEFPLVVNPIRLALGSRPFIENFRWEPARGTRLLVFERSDGSLRGSYAAEACFAFHHVNAFEEDSGSLTVDLVAYADSAIVGALYLDSLRGETAALPAPELRRYRIRLDAAEASWEPLASEPLELPRINYARCNGRPYRHVYGTGSRDGSRGGTLPDFLDQIVKVDVGEGSSARWTEQGCYPGEPVFVAAPGAEREDAGVLLSVVLDARAQSSFLLVLDAADLSERARARVPHHIPFGFHGQFARAPR